MSRPGIEEESCVISKKKKKKEYQESRRKEWKKESGHLAFIFFFERSLKWSNRSIFPSPYSLSLSLSLPLHSFEKLSLSHSARKDLETPFPISIQVRSNTEPRFHRYWIKGLTLGCTRNYKVGRLWKSIARCISRDAVDKFSLPLIHPRWMERNATFLPLLPFLTNLNVLGILFVSLKSNVPFSFFFSF